MPEQQISYKDKSLVAIELIQQAAVNFVRMHPGRNTSDVGACLFPHWFDERGYVIKAVLDHLAKEGQLKFTGGGRGRPKIWSVDE